MQQHRNNELVKQAFQLLDEMAEKGGVYPSSVTLDQYTAILDKLVMDSSADVHNCVLELMTKIYYLRDSGECLFANLLMDKTYHSLKMDNGVKVSDINIWPSDVGRRTVTRELPTTK